MDQVRTIMESEMCKRQIEAVATILQDRSRGEQDRVSVDAVQEPNIVKVLYVGPFVLDEELHARAKRWKSRLESAYPRLRLEIDMKVADPPFHTDDIDCKGYWLKPEGREYAARVKSLKKQLNSALVVMMEIVNKERPRMLIGEGQGGTLVAMSSFPLILERACRDRAVTSQQMWTYRQAWSGVNLITVMNPCIRPTSNNAQVEPFEFLRDAFPFME